ncbi:hypothetical protein GCM10022419_011550 [Nonomuraea rosea]|uniref:RDD domain-containing protein n=1 Tax=Nonomuraea rosea TaxID=638574 RepID=A0ABP6VFI6_9ACTN
MPQLLNAVDWVAVTVDAVDAAVAWVVAWAAGVRASPVTAIEPASVAIARVLRIVFLPVVMLRVIPARGTLRSGRPIICGEIRIPEVIEDTPAGGMIGYR